MVDADRDNHGGSRDGQARSNSVIVFPLQYGFLPRAKLYLLRLTTQIMNRGCYLSIRGLLMVRQVFHLERAFHFDGAFKESKKSDFDKHAPTVA